MKSNSLHILAGPQQLSLAVDSRKTLGQFWIRQALHTRAALFHLVEDAEIGAYNRIVILHTSRKAIEFPLCGSLAVVFINKEYIGLNSRQLHIKARNIFHRRLCEQLIRFRNALLVVLVSREFATGLWTVSHPTSVLVYVLFFIARTIVFGCIFLLSLLLWRRILLFHILFLLFEV